MYDQILKLAVCLSELLLLD